MEIFITGATGVLGRPVIDAVTRAGHRARGYARSAANVATLREMGAEPAQGDLFDPGFLREATAGCQAVLHLATQIPATQQLRRRGAWAETDRLRRDVTRLLVDAARENSVAAFIYPSVAFLYPESGDAWIDAATCQPVIADYYRSTLDAEAEVARFTQTGGRGVTLRMGFFYGPASGQSREQLAYAKMGISSAPGAAGAYHPAIWIPDAARAVVAALGDVPAGTYDIVDDAPLTTRATNLALAEAVGRRGLMQLPDGVYRWMLGSEISQVFSRSQRVANRRFKDVAGWAPEMASAAEGWRALARDVAVAAKGGSR